MQFQRSDVELALSFLNADVAYYSILETRGPESAMICLTEPDGSGSFFELISDDEAADIVIRYLKIRKVPVFQHHQDHDKFLAQFQKELANGVPVKVARSSALI